MRFAHSLALVLLAACGGGQVAAPESSPEETSAPAASPAPAAAAPAPGREEFVVEGTLGRLSQAAVTRGLRAGDAAILECYSSRLAAVSVLSGRMDLTFRIARDGSVKTLTMNSSSLGDRVVEQCILSASRALTFERPVGGEAEFTYPVVLDLPEGTRPALTWDSSRIASVSGLLQRALHRCEVPRTRFDVTAYIDSSGAAIASSIAPAEPVDEAKVECLASALARVGFPSPGSFFAKITFALQRNR